MNTTAVKSDLKVLNQIGPGQIKASQIIERKEWALGNKLGFVPVQGVRAVLSVKYAEVDGKATEQVKASGFSLFFEKHGKNGYISCDEALKGGFMAPVGKDADGELVYEWAVSRIGFQPNPDAAAPGTWLKD